MNKMNRQVKVCIRRRYTGLTDVFSVFNVATQLLSASSQVEVFLEAVWGETRSGRGTLSAGKQN